MWTKVMIFLIVFFIVANPATFKIMRKLLGEWVANAEGLATPAGLALHGVVLVILAMYLPRVLMTYKEHEGDEGYASIDDRIAALEDTVPVSELKAAHKRLSNRRSATPSPVAMATGSAPPVTVATTSGPNPQAIVAPGAVAAASPTPVVIAAPMPAGTTSPYFEWNY